MKTNKTNSLKTGKERALFILQHSAKTEFEMRSKLMAEDYEREIIDSIISFLKEYKYIDDFRYAEIYINGRSVKKSYKQIEFELIAKGIDRDIVREVICQFDSDQTETILSLLLKKKIIWQEADEKSKQKSIASLMRKGFRYEQINLVIKGLEKLEIPR
ncbi:regulatory protein RecX [Parasporobacterium paucivorans]|uniref:Regulatory protein RecX n=1 Tax=Parasporobacterium paucivorans DSM 15970 TaxID=1122934 RepID=A0A1M6F911_9FIRM|nr:RecX family transcriptional regulator [Parasporobacterium paucivorans]SHI94162.1 regulatory protein [Parasporobacterium paucivorans DSM 15970]